MRLGKYLFLLICLKFFTCSTSLYSLQIKDTFLKIRDIVFSKVFYCALITQCAYQFYCIGCAVEDKRHSMDYDAMSYESKCHWLDKRKNFNSKDLNPNHHDKENQLLRSYVNLVLNRNKKDEKELDNNNQKLIEKCKESMNDHIESEKRKSSIREPLIAMMGSIVLLLAFPYNR